MGIFSLFTKVKRPSLLDGSEEEALPRIIIIGGGFGGLAVARSLSNVEAEIILLDKKNHHVFQPLLYQIASAVLSPADIASPIRYILRNQQNCKVVLAEVDSINLKDSLVSVGAGSLEYDWLIIAGGATHSYFGNDAWASHAPGLKSLEDAIEIRRRILLAFENAEYEGSDEERKAALTFAVVGGGPTGVELAGAIQEIAAQTIPSDFRNIDTTTTRVVLYQGGDRVLPQFPESLSEKARIALEKMGVEVMLNAKVTEITEKGVRVGDEFLPVANVFWAAGVQGNPLGKTLGVPLDSAGRVVVSPDLSIPGYRNSFVIGDMASAKSANTNAPVPGVAQGAIQMGTYVGKLIVEEFSQDGNIKERKRKPFSYSDRGSMATIGKAKAVADIKGLKLSGFFAWLVWGLIHVLFLVSFRNRFSVMMNWIWNWFSSDRGARLITGKAELQIHTPQSTHRLHMNE